MKYPTKTSYWKRFEKNNPTIALNILYIKEKEICPSYIPKINSNFEKQIILIIIPNDKKEWYHLAVKQFPPLFLKHKGDSYCLNYLHSFRIENSKYTKIKISVNRKEL